MENLLLRGSLQGLLAAAVVFPLAYGQEKVWNNVFSIGPDLVVATGMAIFAFVVVLVGTVRG